MVQQLEGCVVVCDELMTGSYSHSWLGGLVWKKDSEAMAGLAHVVGIELFFWVLVCEGRGCLDIVLVLLSVLVAGLIVRWHHLTVDIWKLSRLEMLNMRDFQESSLSLDLCRNRSPRLAAMSRLGVAC